MKSHSLSVIAATLLVFTSSATPLLAGEADSPGLVVLLVIDQLRRDRLDDTLPRGLGRIVREGRVYDQGVLDHAMTETCPGHATMLTGQHPGRVGAPGNRFIDPESGRAAYCVADPQPSGVVLGGLAEEGGRSPRNLRATTLGDWMKARDAKTRVFSVSGKDRAAIAMGGQRPDAAYWLNKKGDVGFTTSRYYLAELPAWVKAFNGEDPLHDGFLAGLPATWTHDPEFAQNPKRPDDFAGESEDKSRTSGHPLYDADPQEFADNLYFSPYLDEVTLAFARKLVEQENLGGGSRTDVLAVSLSSTDLIGHLYGPYSHESRDGLRRLDVLVGEFLSFLEARLGKGRVLLALTADHGVLPLPDWLEQTGESECSVEGGRIGLKSMGAGLLWDLHRRFTWILTWPKEWITFAGTQISVNRDVAKAQGVEVAEIVSAVEDYLERQPGIARVWNKEEIRSGTDALAELYRHSYDPERSGDLLIQIESTCLISPFDVGTTHGTPNLYDRAVPIVFWGTGIEPSHRSEAARTVDIAPTLARRLGLTPPEGLDGQPLF
ncbi:MAG: alkaline phosphatase family protein [bacterium]|nr:alkaline phosphatase family protein [bacterium]